MLKFKNNQNIKYLSLTSNPQKNCYFEICCTLTLLTQKIEIILSY